MNAHRSKNHVRTAAFLLLVPGIALPIMSQTPGERKAKIEQHEAATPSAEAAVRKTRSMERLKKEGVPSIAHLPVIEDSKECRKRTAEEIAHRAIAVCITAVKGEGLDQATVEELVKKYGAEAFFTPKEKAFIKDPSPADQDRVNFAWRYECAWVLLWALGYVESLERPEKICDVVKLVGIVRDHSTAELVKDAKLRPPEQLLDEADLIYRYHWATTSARLKGQDAPGKLEAGVVMERHYVLNWLIGYMDEEWDDVSTDT